jgi:two-component system response regulator AtoC
VGLRKILVVDDSPPMRVYLSELLQLLGFSAHQVRRKTDFLAELRKEQPHLILLGSCKTAEQLQALVNVVQRERGNVPIVYIGGPVYAPKTDDCSWAENTCCVLKNFEPNELKSVIDRLIERACSDGSAKLDKTIVGRAPIMLQIKRNILKLSKAEIPVLITGESGTGKELVARAIHDFSPKAKMPFIKVNTPAIPSTLLESELFGYERGAFTGAWAAKPGKFALAHAGSIFLDEIGEIPPPIQAKLLQVLQDGELSALGSTVTTMVNARVFTSTNAKLADMVSRGRFRVDLYYRLNGITIHLPPLRERREDIHLLCDHFLGKYSASVGKSPPVLKDHIRQRLHEYSWPGNVRELQNLLQSVVLLGDEASGLANLKNVVEVGGGARGNWPSRRPPATPATAPLSASGQSLKYHCWQAACRAESDAIMEVLVHTRWNRKKTAEILQVSYKALLGKIREYRISELYRDRLSNYGERQEGEDDSYRQYGASSHD